MEDLTEKFFLSCRRKGIEEETIQEIWRQVESFAEYGFCKGHSAAFAVLSYLFLVGNHSGAFGSYFTTIEVIQSDG